MHHRRREGRHANVKQVVEIDALRWRLDYEFRHLAHAALFLAPPPVLRQPHGLPELTAAFHFFRRANSIASVMVPSRCTS
jgi:hypothetical protein